jgi:succinate dehydrogenase/fumarate reductase flavoprotein subunit
MPKGGLFPMKTLETDVLVVGSGGAAGGGRKRSRRLSVRAPVGDQSQDDRLVPRSGDRHRRRRSDRDRHLRATLPGGHPDRYARADHGPGGHSLLDCQVFGRIAGEEAARYVLARSDASKPSSADLEAKERRLDGLSSGDGTEASQARERLQGIMSRHASVVRAADGLAEGLAELEVLRAAGIRADDRGIVFASETSWMFPLAEMVLRTCALRTESRGPHLFFAAPSDPEPCPRDEERWRRYIVIRRAGDGSMEFETCEPVTTGNSLWVAENAPKQVDA